MTQNLRTIKDIPKRVEGAPPLLEVRGEAYLPRSAFAELNEQRAAAGEPTYANPRNTAAGSIRQLDSSRDRVAAAVDLGYSIGALEGIEFESHLESLEWLREHGLPGERATSSAGTRSTRSWPPAGAGRSGASRWTSRSTAWW